MPSTHVLHDWLMYISVYIIITVSRKIFSKNYAFVIYGNVLPHESALLWEHCIFESVVVATSKFTRTQYS